MWKLSNTAVALSENQKILKSLRFSQMQARHYNIEVAHTETYQWIFQDIVSDKRGKTVKFRAARKEEQYLLDPWEAGVWQLHTDEILGQKRGNTDTPSHLGWPEEACG